MTNPRHLSNPPIAEALIDLRVDSSHFSAEKVSEVAGLLGCDYPRQRDMRQHETRVEVGPDRVPEAQTRDLGLRGMSFLSEDELQVAQFRIDGFTMNRLAPYTEWDDVFPEAMRLWETYRTVFEPDAVRRIAVRYINHIELDWKRADLSDYLRSPVPIPPELPHDMTSFFTSLVLEESESPYVVKVTQSIEPPHEPPCMVLQLDIDAFCAGAWAPGDAAIKTTFEGLRDLKNRVFFSSLTDRLIKGFE